MKQIYMILFVFLLIGSRAGSSQMETKSLINLLNFQATLIDSAEIKFLWYEKFLIPPDDIDKIHQQTLVLHEQDLRDAHKTLNPNARKVIMKHIEQYRKYENFRYVDENFLFKEINRHYNDLLVSYSWRMIKL